MWRATVIERIMDGQVVVSIPALFRGDPVGPMQSAVDAQVGDAVVVADLVPEAKVRDWWVVGYESQVGRWGDPYPHTHPVGQVTGVDAAGNETTLTEILAGKANVGDTTDLSGYVTDTELSTALSGYTTDTELSTALSGKASTPGNWVQVPLDSRLVPDSRSTEIPHASVAFAIRNTPFGQQIRGLYNIASTIPAWTLLGTIPDGQGVRPYAIMRPLASGVMTGGQALQVNIDRDGTIRNRDEWTTGWVSFDWTAPSYN